MSVCGEWREAWYQRLLDERVALHGGDMSDIYSQNILQKSCYLQLLIAKSTRGGFFSQLVRVHNWAYWINHY